MDSLVSHSAPKGAGISFCSVKVLPSLSSFFPSILWTDKEQLHCQALWWVLWFMVFEIEYHCYLLDEGRGNRKDCKGTGGVRE